MTRRIDPGVTVQLPHQRLLDRVPSHPVLCERAATQPDDLTSALEDRLVSKPNVFEAVWHHVGMEVAIRDVTPNRVVESPIPKGCPKQAQGISHVSERNDHVSSRLLDRGVDIQFRLTDAPINRLWYRLAERKELFVPPAVLR